MIYMGPIGSEIRMAIDEDGYRTYTAPFLVKGIPGIDGPYNASICDGIPRTGTTWRDVFPNDIDTCAWCRPTVEIMPHGAREGTQPEFWKVVRTYSTKPQQDAKERCNNIQYCDPTEEIQKITFEFSSFTEEASFDRFGRRVLSSSHEPIHGPINEWEFTRTIVVIEQNVVDGQHTLIEQMKDTVNDRPLWGFPARTIKFRPRNKARHIRMSDPDTGTGFGECDIYWTRVLAFEIKFRVREGVGAESSTGTAIELTPIPSGPYETWDRDVWDEGTRVLRGYWSNVGGQVGTGTGNRTHWTLIDIDGSPPNPDNPQHFIRFKDWNGENQRTLLDGRGKPAFVPTVEPKYWVQKNIQGGGLAGDLTSYTIVHLPCQTLVLLLRNLPSEILTLISFYGPFSSNAEAQEAIDDLSLGDPFEEGECDESSSAGVIHIEKYGQSNFLLLGIPEDLDIPLPPFTLS